MMGWSQSGIDSKIRVTDCLRLLQLRFLCDTLGGGARMGEESIRHYFRTLMSDVIAIYGEAFSKRRPTDSDRSKIELEYRATEFKGCVVVMGCIKLFWKICLYTEKGQYHNPKGK